MNDLVELSVQCVWSGITLILLIAAAVVLGSVLSWLFWLLDRIVDNLSNADNSSTYNDDDVDVDDDWTSGSDTKSAMAWDFERKGDPLFTRDED